MRIGLLNNLRAGRSDRQVTRVLRFLSRHPEVVHTETSATGALPEALYDLAREEVDLLVVNGGDGTLQHTLTEILGNREFGDRVPLIAPLRGGRTNMTALDLGAQRDPIKGLASLIEAARTGTVGERIVTRKVLRVEYGPPREVRYGMFFGAGMIHRAIELTHRVMPSGRGQGVAGATLVTGTLIGRVGLFGDTGGVLVPDKMQILLDSEPVAPGELTLVIASTLDRLFAGMRPFWGVGQGGVRFTTIINKARHFWRSAPGILAGHPSSTVTEENGYTSRNVKCAELRLDCGTTVDGELVSPQSGRIVSLTADETVRFVRA